MTTTTSNNYAVSVRLSIEVDVHLSATDQHDAQRLAHDWVENNIAVLAWDQTHILAHFAGDSPVFWANCSDVEMDREPEDHEVTELAQD